MCVLNRAYCVIMNHPLSLYGLISEASGHVFGIVECCFDIIFYNFADSRGLNSINMILFKRYSLLDRNSCKYDTALTATQVVLVQLYAATYFAVPYHVPYLCYIDSYYYVCRIVLSNDVSQYLF